jgi:hypothetical protein
MSGTGPRGATKPKANNDPYQQMLITNPSKGLNNLISNNLIDDLESPSLMNVQYVEAGAPGKTDGYSLALTTATLPRGLGYFNDAPNSAKYLLTVDGTGLKNVLTGGAITGATFSGTGTIFMTEVDGAMAIWDGVNGGAELASGGTLSRPGTMPSAAFSIYWNGVHAAAGVKTSGCESRLYITGAQQFSATTATISPFQFTNNTGVLATVQGVPGATVFNGQGAQYIDVQPGDSDKITGLSVFQNNLIIFKERSIFQFSFDTSGEPVLQMITQAYGCVSFKSVQRVDNDVFFLTRNGVYVLGYEPNYFAIIRTNELSARIHPLIQTINPANFMNACSMFHQYVYYLGIPASTSYNSLVLTYDRRYQAWSTLNLYQPESFCIYNNTNNNETMYFTSGTSNQIFQITPGVYSANGSAINSYWYSKSYDLGNFNLYKRWVDCAIFFRQLVGTVTVTFYTDNGILVDTFSISNASSGGLGNDQIGAFLIGGNISSSSSDTSGSAVNVPYRFTIGQKSRTIQVQVANSNINENFVILGLAFRYRPYSSFTWNSAYKIYN